MEDIKSKLNSAQYAAVSFMNGPALIIAGAGTGKTRVIEYRVLNLIRNNVNPESILLLTFTRRASKEMLSRAAIRDIRCNNVEGGTFHSFANKVLRKYSTYIGLNGSFTIIDEKDSEDAVKICCNTLGLLDTEKSFPDKSTLKKIISTAINKGKSIGNLLKEEYPGLMQFENDIIAIGRKYVEYKIEKNYVDFDDLLFYLKIILEDSDKIRSTLSEKYSYIMVDEYQDTNKLQGDITFLLAKGHKNVMVVGDDAQSIYGFRGATHENIMQFSKAFPDCAVIKLEENYRSTQPILDVSNAILKEMKYKYEKFLISAKKINGTIPRLKPFKNYFDVAEYVAEKIKEFYNDGTAFKDQAVLFRSGRIANFLQVELNKRNIPYQIFGGRKFNETAHVKDILSYLKIILNPRDDLAWNRALVLINGIGPKTSEKIRKDISLISNLNEAIEIINQNFTRGSFPFGEDLEKLLSSLKDALNDELTVVEKFRIMAEYYKPFVEQRYDDSLSRMLDLDSLEEIAGNCASLDDFLSDLAINPPDQKVVKIEPSDKISVEPLTLSTVHSAKGLEWRNVFIIGLNE
jgi:DNA helicase-2/ATP-dependent DNA helicase PcrA